MSEKKKKKRKLDQESWHLWYELEVLEGSVDRWCCRIIKQGDFEEKAQSALYPLCGEAANLLKVNFCVQCGEPLKEDSEVVVSHEGCCCELASMIEFIELFEPKTAAVHRLKANFCFNCGKVITKLSESN